MPGYQQYVEAANTYLADRRAGYPGGPPQKTGAILADPPNGVHATVAIMTALVGRTRTGQGQFIHFSQPEERI